MVSSKASNPFQGLSLLKITLYYSLPKASFPNVMILSHQHSLCHLFTLESFAWLTHIHPSSSRRVSSPLSYPWAISCSLNLRGCSSFHPSLLSSRYATESCPPDQSFKVLLFQFMSMAKICITLTFFHS